MLKQGPNKKVTIHKVSCVVRQAELMSSMTQTMQLRFRNELAHSKAMSASSSRQVQCHISIALWFCSHGWNMMRALLYFNVTIIILNCVGTLPSWQSVRLK